MPLTLCRQRHYIHEESHWLPGIEEVEDRVRNVEEQLESENINVTNCYCDVRDLCDPLAAGHTQTQRIVWTISINDPIQNHIRSCRRTHPCQSNNKK
ncbi:hypothetical protein DPMN_178809 [Dreissena polymorpha]|uniref:Uncharacterized protein n=1 Tax=Dreissena polymorpha TaxID=45954 RepID=A0A9D4ECX0_DREPO|nr:hypothetical protein DPMN_178809 [Dreissena polymorpha]